MDLRSVVRSEARSLRQPCDKTRRKLDPTWSNSWTRWRLQPVTIGSAAFALKVSLRLLAVLQEGVVSQVWQKQLRFRSAVSTAESGFLHKFSLRIVTRLIRQHFSIIWLRARIAGN